jgi:hypothetical protein
MSSLNAKLHGRSRPRPGILANSPSAPDVRATFSSTNAEKPPRRKFIPSKLRVRPPSDGTIQATEVSAEGHVPELRIKNSGGTPVLILDGGELIGAKQNRTVDVTILVAPQSEVVIPVSSTRGGPLGQLAPWLCCRGPRAQSGDALPQGRGGHQEPKERHVRSADQRAVWAGVDKTLFALGAASPTSALSDGFDSCANTIDGFLDAKVQPAQIGVIYRIDGPPRRPRSLRFGDRPRTRVPQTHPRFRPSSSGRVQ